MKKILSFFAAMLCAVAVFADTDFAAPGYSCAADDATLTGGSSSNFYLDESATPHHIAWSDVSLSSNALATWTVTASRGCYVSVSLELTDSIASNKHIFEVKILDANNNQRGVLAEPAMSQVAHRTITLDGTILLPVAGVYTVELRNNQNWGKGAVANVTLTYAADAPSEIIAVSSVEINKTELALDLEEVEQLSATVSPDNATDPTLTWASSDETVAIVSEDGFVTAIAAGTANITATAGEKSATCAVTVDAAAIPDVAFTSDVTLSAKNAHLEGKIWKKYEDEMYKLYGDGGSNEKYGNALWTINVTNPCIISATILEIGAGCLYELDVFKGEDSITTVIQSTAAKWWTGSFEMEGSITLAEAGNYTFRLRNVLAWSSGKTAGVKLSYKSALPKAIYLKPTSVWAQGGAQFGVYAYQDGLPELFSNIMTLAENETDIYTTTIPENYHNVVFLRLTDGADHVAWDQQWNQSIDLAIPEGKDMFTVTGWNGGEPNKGIGEWSKYGEVIPQVKFKIAGSMSDSWAPSIESFEDSYTLHLEAGTHRLKVVTLENAWKGYTDLTEANRAAEIFPDQSGNICFVLAAEGDVVVSYTNELYKVEGAFIPAPVQLIGIGGWDADTYAIALTPAEDHLTASVTLNLDAWYYEFKMIVAGAWLGKENAEGLYGLHREWTSVDGLTYEGGNIKLTMDAQDIVPGSYTFTWEYATGKLTVTFPTPAPTGITWELNGGAVLPKGCDTNEELWEAFKPDYNAFYSAARADQPIDKVSTFVQDNPGSKSMMMSETSGWKWLGDYLIASCADQGDESWDLSAGTDQQWRMTLHSFFNKENKTNWPMGSSHALFSEAGKEEHWLAAYAEMVLPESVSAEYTLPAVYKAEAEFGGWYDNAEFSGEALTVIPANYAGTLYAKWNSAVTNIENTAAAVKAIKIIENGQMIIIRGNEKFNVQGQVIR